MSYILMKKASSENTYAFVTATKAIENTTDHLKATIFHEKIEAEELLKKATKKLKDYKLVSVKDDQLDEISRDKDAPIAAGEEKSNTNCSRKCFSLTERSLVYSKTEGHCAICGKFVPYTEFTVDHVIPLAKGGSNDLSNLQCACTVCNRIKQDILPEDLMDKLFEIIEFQIGKKENKKMRKRIRKML